MCLIFIDVFIILNHFQAPIPAVQYTIPRFIFSFSPLQFNSIEFSAAEVNDHPIVL